MWEIKRVEFDLDVGWMQVPESEKERAVDIILEGADPSLELDWGSIVRSVIRWRLYKLHRLARMKKQRAKGDKAGGNDASAE